MTQISIPLLRIQQWCSSWDRAQWNENDGLPEPPKSFYIGSVSISVLRKLSGVSHRDVGDRRSNAPNTGYQRPHDRDRSEKVARYIRWGYPLSSQASLSPAEFPDLIHPGWLPTAILVNVLSPGSQRRRSGRSVSLAPQDAIAISSQAGTAVAEGELRQFAEHELAPLEIIDGQHRLFAVDELDDELSDYEVPVVFFENLTPQWQAYLFWVINVEPKKINPSLAFDLYPELRSQTWLEQGEWIKVYREHRAQELVEALWRYPSSPWSGRIELMGKRIPGHVSNAAFIRSLMASFVRPYKTGARIGGLFGSIDKRGVQYAVPWKRAQQAAVLVRIWQHVKAAVESTSADWAASFRRIATGSESPFSSQFSLLATDQGVRAVLTTFNAAMQLRDDLPLEAWYVAEVTDQPDIESVTLALASLQEQREIDGFLNAVAVALASKVDWRSSSHPALSPEEKLVQGTYRGSSGYAALTRRALDAARTVLATDALPDADLQEATEGEP